MAISTKTRPTPRTEILRIPIPLLMPIAIPTSWVNKTLSLPVIYRITTKALLSNWTSSRPKTTMVPPHFNGVGKNKGSFANSICLQPVRLTHSTVPFVHLTSFSTPRISISCLNTNTYPHPRQKLSRLFYLRIFCPLNQILDHCRYNQLVLIISS